MPGTRYSIEWEELILREPAVCGPGAAPGGPFAASSELAAAAPRLAAWYNEPVNRALMTNQVAFTAGDIIERFNELQRAGDRPFLLYRGGELVGDGDHRNLTLESAEYAVLIGPREAQAKGLGTRFSALALALAFGPLGLRRIFASVIPANRGSLRMFEKLGFRRDDSPEARRCADAADDVCLSIDERTFGERHAQALACSRVSVDS